MIFLLFIHGIAERNLMSCDKHMCEELLDIPNKSPLIWQDVAYVWSLSKSLSQA